MKKNTKKALSALLALMIFVGLTTLPALAAPAVNVQLPAEPETYVLTSAPFEPSALSAQSLSGYITPASTTPTTAMNSARSAPFLQPLAGHITATPTASTVLVNGSSVAFDAYNIGGNNYFKLRDIAYTLNGTVKQFHVGWDSRNNAISLTSGRRYVPVGGEMARGSAGAKTPTPTSSTIYHNGREVQLTAYNIDGNNYFKLRDIGLAFNFAVDWDSARSTIVVDTGRRYTDENGSFSYSDSYFGAAQGSAKFLEGRSLIVSIFLSRSQSSWSSQDVNTARQRLGVTTSWIESEGRRYGKDVELIYDFSENPDLRYNMTYDGEFYEYPNEVAAFYEDAEGLRDTTNTAINDFIEDNVPYLALADRYATDSIAYMVFIDYGRESRSYAYQCAVAGPKDRYHEKVYIMGNTNPPSVMAHEILHIFGAVDLYVASDAMGVSNELYEYALQNLPDDIMRSAWAYDSSGNRLYDSIPKTISPLTAHSLGWLADTPELSRFPEFRITVPAAVYNRALDLHGTATWTWSNGTYTGNWDNGVRSGQGVMTYTNGVVYSGNWDDGVRSGYGTMTWPEGHRYEGNWLDSYRSGQGVMTNADGIRYEGTWENDSRNGYGVMTWPEGHRYEGSFINDSRTGYGVMYYPSGHVYEGHWENGVRSGYGVMTAPNGTVQDGMWVNGEFAG